MRLRRTLRIQPAVERCGLLRSRFIRVSAANRSA
jgi:hypothetical protein